MQHIQKNTKNHIHTNSKECVRRNSPGVWEMPFPCWFLVRSRMSVGTEYLPGKTANIVRHTGGHPPRHLFGSLYANIGRQTGRGGDICRSIFSEQRGVCLLGTTGKKPPYSGVYDNWGCIRALGEMVGCIHHKKQDDELNQEGLVNVLKSQKKRKFSRRN